MKCKYCKEFVKKWYLVWSSGTVFGVLVSSVVWYLTGSTETI